MKIRTDFVTNSSSSSYCVSLAVKTTENKKIELDFWDELDGEGDEMFPLKEDMDTVISEIKECQSVEELRDFLMNAINIREFFEEVEDEFEVDADENIENSKYLTKLTKALKEDEDDDFEYYADYLKYIKKQMTKFKKAMNENEGMDSIQSVTIYENFSGWGEFARDGIDDFLTSAMGKDAYSIDADEAREFFADKLSEHEMECIIDQIENDSICQFNADIATTIILADGTVKKTYSFSGD